MSWLLSLVFNWWVRAASALYGSEGINIPLMFMPTRYIGLTLARYGAQIGDDVRFRAPLTIHNGAEDGTDYYRNLSIGAGCYLGRDLFLDLEAEVTIEDNVTISHRVMILTHTDAGNSPLRHETVVATSAPVTIRSGAYVGAGVTILQGVEIGACAVVGAGALVRNSVAANMIVAGVPARTIRTTLE